MNGLQVWNNDRKLGFGVLAVAKWTGASHFLVETPAKIRGKVLEGPWGKSKAEADNRQTQIRSY
jgi:hypothetical protein